MLAPSHGPRQFVQSPNVDCWTIENVKRRNEGQHFFFGVLSDVHSKFDLVFVSGQVVALDGNLAFVPSRGSSC